MNPLAHDYAPRFDAAESVFVERALLWIEEQTYNTVLPPMEGRRYVKVNNKAPAGAKSTAYKQYTRVGLARLITERGQDLPNVGLFVKEFKHDFFAVGASYQYDYLDLLAAAFSAENGGPPLNLDLEGSVGAATAIEHSLDIIAAVGSASSAFALETEIDVGMLGLLNQPSATQFTVAVGGAGFTTWATKTPDEIIADLTSIVATMISVTYKAFVPDSMVGPVLQYESIGGRSMGDGRSDTILSYFLRTNKHIKDFDSWIYNAGAGSGGTDRLVAYENSERVARHMISMEFQQLPPQLEGFTYEVPCLAKTAGVVSSYPIGITYADGI